VSFQQSIYRESHGAEFAFKILLICMDNLFVSLHQRLVAKLFVTNLAFIIFYFLMDWQKGYRTSFSLSQNEKLRH